MHGLEQLVILFIAAVILAAAARPAREAILAMRASDEIGDNAFHQIEEHLDWLDRAAPNPAQAT